jgi:isopenicillin-N N-acyltransferase-like protein
LTGGDRTVSPIKALDLEGDAFSCGLAHGRALAREVAENVETYLRRFEASGLDRGAALKEGEVWADAIAAGNAAYAEEMRGIAEGAGLSLGALAMLNARYEIAFTLFGKEARAVDRAAASGPEAETDGCTTFGVLPEATADGCTYLGQNWDWLAGIHGRAVVLRLRRAGRPNLICLTEAGIVGGKMGLNECGIGLVENGLASDRDGKNPYEKPFHVRCREVLDAEAFDQALLPILRTRRVCSANYVIGDAGGEIIDLETSPDHVAPLHPRDGIVTHSNHFLDPRNGVSLMERIGPNTLFRANRLERLLRRQHGRLDHAAFEAALRDHLSRPYSICRHPDPRQPDSNRTMTVCSVILNLDLRSMHVANGPPCENDYVAFGLDGRLSAAA